MQIDEDDQRGDDQRHEQHGTDKQCQQSAVLGEDGQAVADHIGIDQTHDAEGRQIDDPAYDLGHRVRRVGKEDLGALRTVLLHSQTEQARPEQDADVVAVEQRAHGVGHKVGQQGIQHLTKALRHHFRLRSLCQNDGLGEQKARNDRNGCRQEGGEHIQPDDCAEPAVQLGGALRQCAGHDDEDQNRRNAFQGTHEQVAEFFQPARTGDQNRQHCADDEAHQDPQDQAGGIVLCHDCLQRFHIKTLLYLSCTPIAYTFSYPSTRNM